MDCVCQIFKVLVQSLTFNTKCCVHEYIKIIIKCHIPYIKICFGVTYLPFM